MSRTRISTTVDHDLLNRARACGAGKNDAQMLDTALRALLEQYRRAEFADAYERAYREHPIDEPDEWGDLASFRTSAARS